MSVAAAQGIVEIPDISETKMVIATDGSCKLGVASGCAIYVIHPRPCIYRGTVEQIVALICGRLAAFAKANDIPHLKPFLDNLKAARLEHTGPVSELTAACFALTLTLLTRMGSFIITDCMYVWWICGAPNRHTKPKPGGAIPNKDLVALVNFLKYGLKEYYIDYKFDIYLYRCPSHQLKPAYVERMIQMIEEDLPNNTHGIYASNLRNWWTSNDATALPAILELHYISELYAKSANEPCARIFKIKINEVVYYLSSHFALCCNHVVDKFASYKHYGPH